MDGNIQGHSRGRTLAINPLAALKHKTRFHELAHIVLGHTDGRLIADTEKPTRAIAEVEAEGAAYLLCAILGLPGLDEARGYIQHWLASETLLDTQLLTNLQHHRRRAVRNSVTGRCRRLGGP